MSMLTYVFFGAFALVIVGTYIAVRRGWGNLRMVAAVCMAGSVITMMLAQISRVTTGGNPLAAGIIGALVGALGGAAVLALAWYFHSQESSSQR
jgi:multisubunit Na+/H+ antiporter MnhC subunit